MNSTRPPFDAVTMCLHWLTLVLIASLFATAWLHNYAEGGANAAALLQTHRSLGIVVWLVSLGRLVWRHTGAYLPPFPEHMSKAQQIAAKASEYALYALLLVQPLTGIAQTLLRGRGFDIFLTHVGPLVDRNTGPRPHAPRSARDGRHGVSHCDWPARERGVHAPLLLARRRADIHAADTGVGGASALARIRDGPVAAPPISPTIIAPQSQVTAHARRSLPT